MMGNSDMEKRTSPDIKTPVADAKTRKAKAKSAKKKDI